MLWVESELGAIGDGFAVPSAEVHDVAGQDGGRKLSYIDVINTTIYC